MTEQTTKQNSSKLVTASARHLHIAPRKMRLVSNAIKGMSVGAALVQLHHMNKKAAPLMIKLLNSAVANATNNFSLDADHLFIKSITTDMGKVMKRYFPRARGSAFVIRRKMSHINVVLEERKKSKAVKTGLFKKTAKPETAPSIDSEEATNTKPKADTSKKSQIGKTEQQVKENKAQNKRRLFNRKSGV